MIHCILSSFYIKPQPAHDKETPQSIVSYRLSTSNHNRTQETRGNIQIVSYRLSTSNHNMQKQSSMWDLLYLIVFLHQTTTGGVITYLCIKLYLIVFLHQTTTAVMVGMLLLHCILSSFYIKPQRCAAISIQAINCILSSFYIKPQLDTINGAVIKNCILSSFYIKPQLSGTNSNIQSIVSYRLSTSNHNATTWFWIPNGLYLIVFLHQTTTSFWYKWAS